MNRQQALQILAVMDEDKLMQCMSAAGINCTPDGKSCYGMDDDSAPAEGLESWNATKIAMPDSQRPALYNKRAYLEQPIPAAAPRRAPMSGVLGQEASGMEDFAAPNPEAAGF